MADRHNVHEGLRGGQAVASDSDREAAAGFFRRLGEAKLQLGARQLVVVQEDGSLGADGDDPLAPGLGLLGADARARDLNFHNARMLLEGGREEKEKDQV